MKLRTRISRPAKQHSRIVNLMALTALLWGTFTLSASAQLPPVDKMLAGYVSWGMMIYLLMGFFFTRRPSGSIALLGGVAALGAELGHFDLISLAALFANMPFFLLIIIPVSMICYAVGILVGWLLEVLLKALWRRARTRLVCLWSDSGASIEA